MMNDIYEKVIKKFESPQDYDSFQINPDYELRDRILGISVDWKDNRHMEFKNLDIDGLGKLIINDFVFPFLRVNNMPSLKEIYLFLVKYPVIRLGGTVFNPTGKRPRYGLSIDRLVVNESEVTDSLRTDFIEFSSSADEVSTDNGLFCWWD